MTRDWVRLTSLETLQQLRTRIAELAQAHPWIRLDADAEVEVGPKAPLATRLARAGLSFGNRFATLPMEGWDATPEGRPTPSVLRRWRRFGSSGAALVWGGEAYAVRTDGAPTPTSSATPKTVLPISSHCAPKCARVPALHLRPYPPTWGCS